MADILGKCERQVRKDMAKLEEIRLLRHGVRGGHRSNTYEFLWHPWFDEYLDGLLSIRGEERPPESVRHSLNGTGLPHKPTPVNPRVPVTSGTPVPVGTDLSGTPVPPKTKSEKKLKRRRLRPYRIA
jgi:hypothetical protein